MECNSENVLVEMRQKLEEVRALATNELETTDGLGYLDVKYLLFSSYNQHLVFLSMLKAEGRSIADHPVVQRLAEIRLFLEKIRPLDKKLQYQIDKLLKQATAPASDQYLQKPKDELNYKPNPDMLVSKFEQDAQEGGGVYKPPKLAPAAMDEGETAKEKRMRKRGEQQTREKALRSSYIKELADELEGRPEEIRETYGTESKEFQTEIRKLDERAKQEEDLFARVPMSRVERKKLKQMKRTHYNGLAGLMDDFNEDVAGLVAPEDGDMPKSSEHSGHKQNKKQRLGVKKGKNKFKRKK